MYDGFGLLRLWYGLLRFVGMGCCRLVFFGIVDNALILFGHGVVIVVFIFM